MKFRNQSVLLLENFMLFPTLCRNLTPLFDGGVVHVPHAVGGGGLEGEVVLVLHAVGADHVVDTEVAALLDGALVWEVTHVLPTEGAGHIVDAEVAILLGGALEDEVTHVLRAEGAGHVVDTEVGAQYTVEHFVALVHC